MKHRRSRVVVCVALVALVAASCGGDDDAASGDGNASADASEDTSSIRTDGIDTTVAEPSIAPAPTGPESSTADADCPPDSDGITMGVGSFVSSLDPTVALGSAQVGATEMTALYDTLMRYDPATGEYIPHVAESLEAGSDLTEYTLHLRDDIRFGNGNPLTADVVRANVERMAGSRVSSAGLAQEVASMEVVDDLTITFKLKKPWGSFAYFLASEGGMMVDPSVVEERGAEAFSLDPSGAGVGPYEFVRFRPDEEIVFRAKDDYWGGPVCIPSLRFVRVPGGEATYDAFRNGELDVAFLNEAAPIAQAKSDGVTGLGMIGGAGIALLINNGVRGQTPPTTDLRLRQAIAYAMDVDTIDDRVNSGSGHPSSALLDEEQLLYSGVAGPEYAPDVASDLVSQVKAEGWDGSIRLVCGDTPSQIELSITVAAMLEAVGFRVARENVPTNELVQRFILEPDFDIGCSSIALFDTSVLARLNQFYSDSVRNRAGYANPDMDAALDELTRAVNVDETKAALATIQKVWNETVPWAALASSEWFSAIVDGLDNVTLTRDAVLMFHDARWENGTNG